MELCIRSLAPRTSCCRRLELVGRLKSHGVWVCVTCDEQLVLFHLVRAQEQMLFARMMASHVLPTENFQQPVKLSVGQVFYSVGLFCQICPFVSKLTRNAIMDFCDICW